MNPEKLRIDKYLWAIRIFKTRTQASSAIQEGKVTLNGEDIKASRQVSVGDIYEIKTEARKWIIEVIALLDHRVAYPEAIQHYTDLTPEEEIAPKAQTSSFVEFTGKRHSKQGRPTKKNRRDLGDVFDL